MLVRALRFFALIFFSCTVNKSVIDIVHTITSGDSSFYQNSWGSVVLQSCVNRMDHLVNIFRCFPVGLGADRESQEEAGNKFLEWADTVDAKIQKVDHLNDCYNSLNNRLVDREEVQEEHLRVQGDQSKMIAAMADIIGRDKIAARIRERDKVSYSETYVDDDYKEVSVLQCEN